MHPMLFAVRSAAVIASNRDHYLVTRLQRLRFQQSQ